MNDGGRLGVIKRLTLGEKAGLLQPVLKEFVPVFGKSDVPGLFVDLEVVVLKFGNDQVDCLVEIGTVLARAGDDQRCPRLVDQDRVHLVDDGEVVVALVHVLQFGLHVVAQIVEPKLVVRRIGDVGGVSFGLLGVGLAGVDHTGLEPERAVDLAHPFGISLGEVVVHGDDVDALAGQRVQIGREGGDERLAFARLHLGDVAFVEEHAAHKLNVEGAKAQRPLARLAAVGEGFGHDRLEALAPRDTLFQLGSLGNQTFVRQRLELRLHLVDLGDDRTLGFDQPVVCRSKDLLCDVSDTGACSVGLVALIWIQGGEALARGCPPP